MPPLNELPELSRRDFVKFASLVLAACTRRPLETIIPYADTPEGRVQGVPQWFATAIPYRGFGFGVLARSFEGRPVKLEGNPDHPASLGATNAIVQASILDLYDPTRSPHPLRRGKQATWSDFLTELGARGRRIAVLTQTVTSPTLLRLLAGFTRYQYDPLSRDSNYTGTQMAFGVPLEPLYHFDRADVIVALDADFLDDVRYARDFTRRRRVANPNRLYAIEPMPTVTGAMADHRIPRRACDVVFDAMHLPEAIARDLIAHRGSAVVVPGDAQPPIVHALAHAMNGELGAIGNTVEYIDALGAPNSIVDFENIDVLIIVGGNPAYDCNGFAEKLARVPFSAHLSSRVDETSRLTTWHLPESHPLESWGDIRAFDGTASIVQPLIAPMYDSRSAIELMAMLAGSAQSGHDMVKQTWANQPWRETLARGVVAGTTSTPRAVTPRRVAAKLAARPPIEINLRPDPTIADGRHAANGWLQELPKPITKIVWGNAALMSPHFAAKLGVTNEDVLDISGVEAPVFIVPGHAEDSVTLHLGHGRDGIGVNAYPLIGVVPSIRKTGKRGSIVTTQDHNTLDGRDLLRVATLEESQRNPDWARKPEKEPGRDETLYSNYKYSGHAWGMAVDLNACIGCGACVVACNAENNIPVVGRDQVALGREMHWIRIDRYFAGSVDNPKIYHQPVLCMHCEDAPCEPVCPVAATAHSSEGLNEQIYNRCIGTRYCSNNCPYKVRRFNFLEYAPKSDALDLMWNPDVTVRSRGVMEKCTYCVQRIERARVAASNEDRPMREGDIVTACQQSCPAEAIVFGDINDANSKVARLKSQKRNYAMLAELNTRPRTTYLGKIRNPNPELEKD